MKSKFSLLDGLLCLALAAHLKPSADHVKLVAKRVAKRLPKSKRGICAIIQASSDPLKVIEIALKELVDAEHSPRLD